MSLGLAAAGFDLVAHVESDASAAATYALNFRPRAEVERAEWALPRDMIDTDPSELVAALGLQGPVAAQFDVLAAGLPCQAFARIGRSKLRSLAGDDNAFKNDPRARLYQRFLYYVKAVQPTAVLIENVPDIMNFGGHNVPEEICDALEALGYVSRYTLLNAAFYGVPQMRERLFLVAIDSSLGVIPGFPSPTHHIDLPAGYSSARTVATRHVPEGGGRFLPSTSTRPGLPDAVTTREALADLPRITEHFRAPVVMRRRRVDQCLPYADCEPGAYARRMRSWRGLSPGEDGTDGHVVRLTPRDFEIFARMRHGGDYPHARNVAHALFEEAVSRSSPSLKRGSAAWRKLEAEILPPYDPGKFPNKWWKLDPSQPSRTLTAHMGKDTYSHIHWDSRQRRTISVREAARLQSFPDGFRFSGAMNASFRQIGNAVPPLLALAVARQLRRELSQTRSAMQAAALARRSKAP